MNALNEARVTEPDLSALESAVEDALGEREAQRASDGASGDEPRAVELDDEMVEFVTKTPDDVSGASFDVEGTELGVVYVDTALTEDIESEGYAREVIRRVQEMRKELDLDIEEAINLELDVRDDRVAELVERHMDLVKDEVRAESVGTVEDGHRKTWDVEGVEMEIAIAPLAEAEV